MRKTLRETQFISSLSSKYIHFIIVIVIMKCNIIYGTSITWNNNIYTLLDKTKRLNHFTVNHRKGD